ncbi:MAG TPA: YdhR family protein [Anaerolineae bacterium]|nr:YdhR family protein [Anaerolineae bacterium]
MSKVVVQVNFDVRMPQAEYEAMAKHAAHPIAEVAGLAWKIFLIGETGQEAAGVYLFESAAAADAYLRSPIITALRQHPGIEKLTVKRLEVQEDITAVTRGPVGIPVTA